MWKLELKFLGQLLWGIFAIISIPIQILFKTEQVCDSVICFSEFRPLSSYFHLQHFYSHLGIPN